MTDQKYRLYSLTNMYLSSIQKGLQTAHVVSELSLFKRTAYQRWAESDRTIIILNGGNCADLESFEQFLLDLQEEHSHNNSKKFWPWAAFREDAQSLNGAITAVGIILPESVYTGVGLNAVDSVLYTRLQKYGLAI
jgi:hypothetical protein